MAAKNTKQLLPAGASIAAIEAAKARQSPPSPTEGKKPATAEELKRRLNITNSIFNTSVMGNGMAGMGLNDDADGATMELQVDQIDFYDRNPRTTPNPEFETIKESIRQKKRISSPLTVTRRPGAARYMLCEGGNTRLLIIKQLWEETGDLAFKKTIVIYRIWRSESEVLSGHLIENIARGSMSFWEKAVGIERLRNDLESERKLSISLRDFEAVLKQVGLPISRSTLSIYESATSNFQPIGEWLSIPLWREIQAYYIEISRVLEKFSIDSKTIRSNMQSALADYVKSRPAEAVGIDPDAIENELVNSALNTLSISLEQMVEYRAICKAEPSISFTEIQGRIKEKQKEKQAATSASVVTPINQTPSDLQAASAPSSQPGISDVIGESLGANTNDVFTPPQVPQALIQRQLSTSIGPISIKSAQEVLDDKKKLFYRKCEEFARACGVVRQMIHAPSMPFSFYMELPGAALDLQEDSDAKTMGWWLLASISGQRDVQTTLQCIDADHASEWRRTMAGGPDTQLGEHELRIEQELGANTELRDFASWVQPANKAAKHAAALIVAWHEFVEYLEQFHASTQRERSPE
jgi:ParB family protein of integrating conjugative element (PFGI_1 class)